MVSFVIIFRNTVHTKNMRKYEKQMRKEKTCSQMNASLGKNQKRREF